MIKAHAKYKIYSFFSFHESYIVFCKGKSTVFGTAFDREPGFKTDNLIKYRIQCRHWSGACVCVRGEGSYNRSFCHPILGDSKFVDLLKTVLTFNHKTNDAIVNKIDHTF